MDEARNRAGRSNLEAGGRSLALREASKRVFDLAILTVAHLVLAPVFIALWTVIPLLIWLEDRGPVFYRQERPGAPESWRIDLIAIEVSERGRLLRLDHIPHAVEG